MKVTRSVTIDVDMYDLVNGVVAYAERATKQTVCPYYWEKLRSAADMMERTYGVIGEEQDGKV
jgi:hypothetical protein